MAIVEVKVPQLSESVAEATLMQWKKKVGESVTADEILIEIETDKVVLEVPAPSSGVLSELVAEDGATVAAEQVIARIDTSGGAVAAAPKAADKPAAEPAKAAAPAAASAPAQAAGDKSRVAMPAAEKMMADNKVDPASVTGTGKDGRILKGDVAAAMAKPAPAAAPTSTVVPRAATLLPQVSAAQPNLGERPEQRVPMSRLRARVAERLLQSQSTAAILTTFNEVNMAPVMEMRKRFQEKFEKEHGV
ncbi:MAG: E3 binding domain-containing protein, partial [Rhodoferax sp.]|nr:E3 binding domain-containing protein [Rhodoferax sp.]